MNTFIASLFPSILCIYQTQSFRTPVVMQAEQGDCFASLIATKLDWYFLLQHRLAMTKSGRL